MEGKSERLEELDVNRKVDLGAVDAGSVLSGALLSGQTKKPSRRLLIIRSNRAEMLLGHPRKDSL